MKITWFGQACFELSFDDGTVVICDPYDPNVGYTPHPVHPDVVTISHEHFDHNYTGWILGSPEVVRGEGFRAVKGGRITGFPSFHDDARGAIRGPNTVFVIEAGGLRLCHLGDLGEMPGKELLAGIGRPDVLFVPAGGYYTIDAAQAAAVASLINAPLTIPMHFATGVKDTKIATVDAFAAATGATRQGGSSIAVGKGYSGPGIVVLDHLR